MINSVRSSVYFKKETQNYTQFDVQGVKSSDDDEVLSHTHLQKKVSLLMSLAFTFTSIGAAASVISYFQFGLQTGGPVVLIWGWIFASVFLLISAFCFAEIVSAYPFAGSVYFWTGKICKPKYAPFASYICGNFILLGAITNVSSYIISSSQILHYIIKINTGVTLETWEVAGIAMFTCWTQCYLNTLKIEYIGYLNEFIAMYITGSTCLVFVFLFANGSVYYFNQKQLSSTEFVFLDFNNQTNIPNSFYVCCIGIMLPIFSQAGYDAAGQLGEETENAEIVAPRAIIGGLIGTQITSFVLILSLLYAIGLQDSLQIQQFLSTQDSNDNVVIHIFSNMIGTNDNSYLMIVVLMIFFLSYFSNISQITYTQRITYALARDGAIPHSGYFRHLDHQNFTPNNTLYLILGSQIIFLGLYVFSSSAFNAIGSISTVGYLIAYFITQLSRLTNDEIDFTSNKFNLGKWSWIMNFISVIFLSVCIFVVFLPQQLNQNEDITLGNLNWNIIISILFFIFLIVRWQLKMKYTFKGPNEKLYD